MPHLSKFSLFVLFFILFFMSGGFVPLLGAGEKTRDIAAPDAVVEKVAGDFHFTEGPAADRNGDLYFVDILRYPEPGVHIHRWDAETGKTEFFTRDECHATGLFFDAGGLLVTCEGMSGALATYDRRGKRTILFSSYEGKRFNQPNDLWIAPNGSIYFTDPVYSEYLKDEQGGEYVYWVPPERNAVIRVDRATRPNGIVGTADGKTLYVADPGDRKIYRYNINADGTLGNKRSFADVVSDGMTVDQRGNLYATENSVIVYDRNGGEIRRFQIPERPTNVCFAGKDRQSLFVTTFGKSLYRIRMRVHDNTIGFPPPAAENAPVAKPSVEKLAGGYVFTEGPAVDDRGNVWFSDDPIFIDKVGGRIYRRSAADGTVTLQVDGSDHVNGMTFDKAGNLVVCEGGSGRVVSYDAEGKRTVLISEYEGKRFNMPNDLWIDPRGGIYFTDPVYTRKLKVVQDGEDVYYLSPDRSKVVKVVDDLVRPNGLVGTPDGQTLYLTDHAACKVWRYDIRDDGTLSGKTLFANVGSDGMTLDESGNVYITERRLDRVASNEVLVLDPSGHEIGRVKFPELPTNICPGKKGSGTFFVTAGKSLYLWTYPDSPGEFRRPIQGPKTRDVR